MLLIQTSEHCGRFETAARRTGRSLETGRRFLKHPDFEIRASQLHVLDRLVGAVGLSGVLPDSLEEIAETRRPLRWTFVGAVQLAEHLREIDFSRGCRFGLR